VVRLDRTLLVGILSRWGTIISLVGLCVAFSVAQPEIFPTTSNLLLVLNQVAILGMLSFGLTTALVMGLFDLSIGGMATLAGFLVTYWLVPAGHSGLAPMLLATLALAVAIGVLNGFMVSYMGISAFIGTLAMGSILTGITLGVSNSQTVLYGIPSNFLTLGQGELGSIPNPVLIMAGVGIVLFFFLERTEPGRHMYAIGGNPEAARLAGVRVKRYALLALGISAVCAGLGGIVVASNLGVGRPQGVGDAYLLSAFAATFIGASTLRPGRFHIFGTLVGVLLLGVIDNGLSIMNVATFWQYIVKGILLIFAVFASGILQRGRR
jgi:ribose transport system permease protein